MPSLLGQLIRHSMRSDDISVADIAELCGVSASTVRDWLSGRIIKPGHLVALADLFGLPLDLLESIATKADGEPIQPSVEPSADSWLVVGYASKFDVVDLGNEIILPGAWRDLPRTVPVWYEHAYQAEARIRTDVGDGSVTARDRTAIPVGSTAKLEQDTIGLWFEAPVAMTRDMLDLIALWTQTPIWLRTSVGFNVNPGGEVITDFGSVLTSLELKEISIVNWPQQELATAELLPGNTSRAVIDLIRLAAGAAGSMMQ